MGRKLLAVFSIVAVFVFSCNESPSNKNKWAKNKYGNKNEGRIKEMNLENSKLDIIPVKTNDLTNTIFLSQILSECKYVPLQTTDSNLIGMIDKIIIKNNRIYLLDQLQSKSIQIYDWEGKLIGMLNKHGKGPGEFTDPYDFAVSEEGNIYVYDEGNKMIEYDEKGNVLSQQKLKFYFSYFGYLKGDYFTYSTDFSSQNYHLPDIHCYNLLVADTNLLIVKKALRYNEGNLSLRVSSGSDFFNNNSRIYYHPFLHDTIYSIQTDTVFSKYLVLFNNNQLSRTNLEQFTDELYKEKSKSSNYLMHPLAISDDVIYLPISHNNTIASVFYNSKTKQSYPGNKLNFQGINNFITYSAPRAAYKNYLIGYIDALPFADAVKAWSQVTDKKSREKAQTYLNVKKDDNPVIIFYKTK